MKSRLDPLLKETTSDLLLALKVRSVYPLIVISADDIMRCAEKSGMKITREAAEKAAHWMFAEYDFRPEYEAAMDYALDRAVELSPELQK